MRRALQFITEHKRPFTLLVMLFLSVTLMLMGESQKTRLTRGVATAVFKTGRFTFSSGIYILDLWRENKRLRLQNLNLSSQISRQDHMLKENERLRSMLQFTKESPYQLQVAEVISRGASSILSTVTLNVGTKHGVEPNFPVLALDGLLGKTMTVASNASVVQLITDRNFRLSVKVGSEGVRGILIPLYGPFAEVTGIHHNSGIRPGDRVLTSGFSDIYPKNLPVALVDEVVEAPGENFSRIKVRFPAEPSEVEHVFVMVGHGPGA